MRISPAITLAASVAIGAVAIFAARGWLSPSKADATAIVSEEAVQQPTTVTVVVAKRNIPRGAVIDDTRLEVQDWPAADVPEGSFRSIPAIGSTETAVRRALSPINAGQPIINDRLTEVGERPTLAARLSPGYRAYSLRMNDVTGVGGFVLPGDRIDVLYTWDKTPEDRTMNLATEVLLQNIEVLGVDLNDDPGAENPIVFKTATVAVSVEDAQKLSIATQSGTLSFVLRGVEDEEIGEYAIAERNPAPTPAPVRTASSSIRRAPAVAPPRDVDVQVIAGDTEIEFTVPGQ